MSANNENPDIDWESDAGGTYHSTNSDEYAPETPNLQAPLPLAPPVQSAAPYPLDALGTILGEAAKGFAKRCQCAPAMAGQSVLAVASLAAMSLADVVLPIGPTGQTRPLSLALVTIAASGERKTTVDNAALQPVTEHEAKLKIDYDREFENWRISFAAWQAEQRKIEADRTLDLSGKQLALTSLGRAPLEPIRPYLIAPEPTIEGLTKHWHALPGGLGLFSAEGGQMTGGSGFSKDNLLKTAAALSALWDGAPLRRFRAGDGITDLPGRRLAVHLMVQPGVADAFLSHDVLRDQGLLSRILVASPESLAGKRKWEPAAGQDKAVSDYVEAIRRLLETKAPTANRAGNELTPRALPFSANAKGVWVTYLDAVEKQRGPGESFEGLQDVAAKSAENAARIAGVLQIIQTPNATEIGDAAMVAGCELAAWYLNEALRLSGQRQISPALRDAIKLLDWLATGDWGRFGLRDILQRGPNSLRTKVVADAALEQLVDNGWLTRQGKGRGAKFTLIRESPH